LVSTMDITWTSTIWCHHTWCTNSKCRCKCISNQCQCRQPMPFGTQTPG
jgi:hypothetical protein